MKAILGISTTILLYLPGYKQKLIISFERSDFQKSREKTKCIGLKINFGKGFIMSVPPE